MQTLVVLSMKEGSFILADDMKSLNFCGRKFILVVLWGTTLYLMMITMC
jgi:hypothetical protein